jgi:hypothetical protein
VPHYQPPNEQTSNEERSTHLKHPGCHLLPIALTILPTIGLSHPAHLNPLPTLPPPLPPLASAFDLDLEGEGASSSGNEIVAIILGEAVIEIEGIPPPAGEESSSSSSSGKFRTGTWKEVVDGLESEGEGGKLTEGGTTGGVGEGGSALFCG